MKKRDPISEPVLIQPGGFNRKVDVREDVVIGVIAPYLDLARTLALAGRKKRRLDWGGLWNVSPKRGDFSIAGPAVGAPNAVTMLESLIANGAKRVFVTGCCGSLLSDVKIGDIIIPTNAVCEEGTSAHYSPDLFPPEADPELTGKIAEIAERKGWAYKKGAVWTTDAPYRETHEKVERYGSMGVLAVEMELSAMFTVARFRGIKLAAALAVSDELATLEWKPGFSKPSFIKATTRSVRLVLNAASRSG